jgi:dTDP-4-amino-4,6-dideoxygalactose transaminase
MSDRKLIPIVRPVMDECEVEAARRVILSGWVTQGPEVAAFEREFAASTGAPHACAVSSATTALHLALLAAGVEPGDEVITVSHSFIATANVIRYCGATPVFCDIEAGGFNIDPSKIEPLITPKTRAILCVHQIGMPCDLERVIGIAQKRGLRVVEDAACAIGSEILWRGGWEKIGKPHGDAACFSFHPRKLVTTGDGGMITTANPEWDQRFRLWRQHGMSVPDVVRHGSSQVVFESYTTLGYNYRLTDVQAAIGREQLRRLPEIVRRRRELADRYRHLLGDLPGLGLPQEPAWARTNWQSYCVRLPDGCDQRGVMQAMLDRGVATRRGVQCAHREPAYPRSTWLCACRQSPCTCLAESERAQDRSVVLPLFHHLSDADQEAVAEAFREALVGRRPCR